MGVATGPRRRHPAGDVLPRGGHAHRLPERTAAGGVDGQPPVSRDAEPHCAQRGGHGPLLPHPAQRADVPAAGALHPRGTADDGAGRVWRGLEGLAGRGYGQGRDRRPLCRLHGDMPAGHGHRPDAAAAEAAALRCSPRLPGGERDARERTCHAGRRATCLGLDACRCRPLD